MARKKKKWTILIYADGNNEMEEVIYDSFESLKRIGELKNINVIIEIGLLKNGVKRYYLNSLSPILLQDLKKTNMADPRSLYNFINWGISEFPANHYMVILSGHGTDFVGGLTDTSLENNYIMGIPEMMKAIALGSEASKSIIDVLVLDMCFMNSIEVLYELAQYSHSIKSMITYTNLAPYSGLDYNTLIESIDRSHGLSHVDLLIKHIIDDLNFELTAYKLDKSKLQLIKKQFNNLAFNILNNKLPDSNLGSLIESNHCSEINSLLQSIIIYSNTEFMKINSSTKIVYQDIGKLIYFYQKLAFSKDNLWTSLLCTNPIDACPPPTNMVKVRTSDSSPAAVHYIISF